jgi:hypothetical protein
MVDTALCAFAHPAGRSRRRHDGIMPVICPTGQMGFVKSKDRNANEP